MEKTYPCPKPDKKSGQIPSLIGALVEVTNKLERVIQPDDIVLIFSEDEILEAKKVIDSARRAIKEWNKFCP